MKIQVYEISGTAAEWAERAVSTKSRDYEEKLKRIANAVAESIFEASDEEILEEVREAGEDPEAVASHVRSVLSDAVRAHRKRHLIERERREKTQ
jgi:hypothetical protein